MQKLAKQGPVGAIAPQVGSSPQHTAALETLFVFQTQSKVLIPSTSMAYKKAHLIWLQVLLLGCCWVPPNSAGSPSHGGKVVQVSGNKSTQPRPTRSHAVQGTGAVAWVRPPPTPQAQTTHQSHRLCSGLSLAEVLCINGERFFFFHFGSSRQIMNKETKAETNTPKALSSGQTLEKQELNPQSTSHTPGKLFNFINMQSAW